MKLTFEPVRMETPLTLERSGETLVVDGRALDLSGVTADKPLSRKKARCHWLAGEVTRDADGVLHVPLFLPHGSRAPQETLFPAAIEAHADCAISLPPFNAPEEAVEED